MHLTRMAAGIFLALAASGCRAATDDDVAQLRAELIEVRAELRQLREELRAPAGAAGPAGSRDGAGSAGSTGRPGAGPPGDAPPATSPASPATSGGVAVAAPSPGAGSDESAAASTVQVPIETDPPGADVYVGETRAGLTPFVLAAPRDVEVHLRLEKAGYRPHLLNLRPTPGGKVSVQLARKGR